MGKELSPAERDFCANYVSNGKNATKAYLAVHPNVKYETARSHGCNLLKREHVKAEIDRLIGLVVSEKIMTREECLEQLTELALTSTDTIKIKAIAEIAKIMGYNMQNINLNTNSNKFDEMTVEELQELADKLNGEVGE